MYNFDSGIQRKDTNCVKWDAPIITDGVTPMWVADMDLPVSPAVSEQLLKAASSKAFGYKLLSDEYYQTIIRWFRDRHGYEAKREWLTYIPNVVLGLHIAVQAVSDPGDEILVQTPVYWPFYGAVKDTGRKLIESPLKNDHGYYTMDLLDFENRITKRTKAVLFCNPHNPSGRVWTKEELQQFVDICMKHSLYIITDDIHCELTTVSHPYTAIPTLSPEVAEKTILLTSPSKAFNLASIHVANSMIPKKDIRVRFQQIAEESHCCDTNAFAEAAVLGAYGASGQWLEELKEYLEGNIDYFVDYVSEQIPKLTVYKPEGTYLVWADCRKLSVPAENLHAFFLENCQVAVNDGTFFGEEGRGFVRFNLACPRSTIVHVLKKIKQEIDRLE